MMRPAPEYFVSILHIPLLSNGVSAFIKFHGVVVLNKPHLYSLYLDEERHSFLPETLHSEMELLCCNTNAIAVNDLMSTKQKII
jgi:predicted cobalt transporter CbtA